MGFASPASVSTVIKPAAGLAFIGAMQQGNTRIESAFLAKFSNSQPRHPLNIHMHGINARRAGGEGAVRVDHYRRAAGKPLNPPGLLIGRRIVGIFSLLKSSSPYSKQFV